MIVNKKKIIIIASAVAIVAVIVYFIIRNKKSSGTNADLSNQNAAAYTGSLISTTVTKKDTSNMTVDEKIAYEADLAYEKEQKELYNQLASEYFMLFGKSAPGGSTVTSLQTLINEYNERLKLATKYSAISGDYDLSDNDFSTIVKVQQAIAQAEQDKIARDKAEAARLEALKATWATRKVELENLGRNTISPINNAATAASAKKAVLEGILLVKQNDTKLNYRDVVFFNDYCRNINKSNKTPYEIFGDINNWQDGAVNYIAYSQRAVAEGKTINSIDQYGNLI